MVKKTTAGAAATKTAAEARRARLAKALRDNLRRRKARAASQSEPDGRPDPQPAPR